MRILKFHIPESTTSNPVKMIKLLLGLLTLATVSTAEDALIDGSTVDPVEPSSGSTVDLMTAAKIGHLDSVKAALERGENINQQGNTEQML